MVETGKPCLTGAYVDLYDESPLDTKAGSLGKVSRISFFKLLVCNFLPETPMHFAVLPHINML